MSVSHEAMLDDVAVYALGVLPPADARRVRDHLASCETCAGEYSTLAPAAASIGIGAELQPTTNVAPALKTRVMREVRRGTKGKANSRNRAERPIVWPAYLVAAACFAIALYSSLLNLSLMQQLKAAQNTLTQSQHRSTMLAQGLLNERETLADLTNEGAQRFNFPDGQIVRVHQRLYLTMHDMPTPPRGKVYQAWTLTKGAKEMQPSLTFVPDEHGAAVITLPVDAMQTAAVAVSIEPVGGSKEPSSKPIIVQSLD